MRFQAKRAAAGFTLVELLAVIVIIGILITLVSVAAVGAVNRAKTARTAMEIDQIATALEAFRTKYQTDYPPSNLNMSDAVNKTIVERFVRRTWKRYNINNLATDLQTAGANTNEYDPGNALWFWLKGFSPDPARPFVAPNDPQIQPIYDFDPDRVANINGGRRYLSDLSGDQNQKAYLYIDSNNYARAYTNSGASINFQGAYRRPASGSDPNTPYNPNKFQIIAAGSDGLYGEGGQLAPVKLANQDGDNITNFSGGNTLMDFQDDLD